LVTSPFPCANAIHETLLSCKDTVLMYSKTQGSECLTFLNRIIKKISHLHLLTLWQFLDGEAYLILLHRRRLTFLCVETLYQTFLNRKGRIRICCIRPLRFTFHHTFLSSKRRIIICCIRLLRVTFDR